MLHAFFKNTKTSSDRVKYHSYFLFLFSFVCWGGRMDGGAGVMNVCASFLNVFWMF